LESISREFRISMAFSIVISKRIPEGEKGVNIGSLHNKGKIYYLEG